MHYVVGVALLLAASALLTFAKLYVERSGRETMPGRIISGEVFALLMAGLVGCGAVFVLYGLMLHPSLLGAAGFAASVGLVVAGAKGLGALIRHVSGRRAKPRPGGIVAH